MKHNFLAIFIFYLLFTGCSANVKMETSPIQSFLDSISSETTLPGLTFSYSFGDTIIHSFAAGYADIENKILMKPNDIMFSGSIGKTYAATIILQLIHEGKLTLTDSVTTIFKGESWLNSVPNAHFVTIEMLLNHTSGIPRYVFDSSVWEEMVINPDKIWSGVDRLEKVYGLEPVHEAGKGWGYSDTNYIILGMIIEKITGNDYYNELINRCLNPFGHKYTHAADSRKINGLVPGYCEYPEFLLPKKVGDKELFPFNPQMEWTGGGVTTNTYDLTKWVCQLHSGKVFDFKTSTKMQKPVPFEVDLGENTSYGFAAIIWDDNMFVSFGHTGFFPGYRSIMEYIPELDMALALQVNTDKLPEGQSVKLILTKLRDIILEIK